MEPNEDTVLVDGTVFGRPDQFLLGPRPRKVARAIVASVDAIEDPVDLYRVAAPANSRLTFTLRPLDDDVDLTIWNANVSGTGFYDRPDEQPLGRAASAGCGWRRSRCAARRAAWASATSRSPPAAGASAACTS